MPKTRLPARQPIPQRNARMLSAISCVLTIAIWLWPTGAHAQFNGSGSNDLMRVNGATTTLQPRGTGQAIDAQPEPRAVVAPVAAGPGEFEQYVQGLPGGQGVRRFGAGLVTDDAVASATQDPLPSVPGDYIIRPGDQILLTIWGTADADLQLTVDRAGRISVPHIGSIDVAGVRNADLADAIGRRVGQTFKNFQLTATLGQVRAIRVFVSGYVQRPGSITVNGLSSVLHAIMRAGGPAASGSFRDIHLRRAGKEVAVFDLYDLLLKGNRDTDRLVQPDDVIFIGPIGTQVALLGSVNQQAIYELRPGETLADVLKMAGGFTAVADRSRVAIERLADRSTGRVTELGLPAHDRDALATGDVARVFSLVTAALPQGKQNQHIHIDGEVVHPGDYILAPGARISDALRAAGGMTSAAYPFGTELTRESVRKTQQANYERALSDLETEIAKNQGNQRVTSSEELSTQAATAQSGERLLERLRQLRPNGRVVLQLTPDATTLPDLPLQDGDAINVPPRGTSVGVFGSVFNTGNFLFEPGHTTLQYLALAGGPSRGADKRSIFMLRANGSVISAQQGASFWHSGNDLNEAKVEPGDTIFVPEEIGKSSFIQDAKDWTQILYQFGLGLAGIKTLGL
jgi:protein involved in polysaccharide export with SLBB domain